MISIEELNIDGTVVCRGPTGVGKTANYCKIGRTVSTN